MINDQIDNNFNDSDGVRDTKNKILASARIFLTDIPKEWRIRRFVESSLEALKRAED